MVRVPASHPWPCGLGSIPGPCGTCVGLNGNQLWNCTHFGHPTEEQLRISDIVRSNIYLQSVPFELLLVLVPARMVFLRVRRFSSQNMRVTSIKYLIHFIFVSLALKGTAKAPAVNFVLGCIRYIFYQ